MNTSKTKNVKHVAIRHCYEWGEPYLKAPFWIKEGVCACGVKALSRSRSKEGKYRYYARWVAIKSIYVPFRDHPPLQLCQRVIAKSIAAPSERAAPSKHPRLIERSSANFRGSHVWLNKSPWKVGGPGFWIRRTVCKFCKLRKVDKSLYEGANPTYYKLFIDGQWVKYRAANNQRNVPEFHTNLPPCTGPSG